MTFTPPDNQPINLASFVAASSDVRDMYGELAKENEGRVVGLELETRAMMFGAFAKLAEAMDNEVQNINIQLDKLVANL